MNESKAVLCDRLKKEGRWEEATLYKDKIIEMLRENAVGSHRRRHAYQQEAWEAVEKAYPPMEVVDEAEHIEVTSELSEGMEFLPEYQRWVALHPALGYSMSTDNEELNCCVDQYEEEYPCPNQTSRTMLNFFRNNPGKLDGLFKDHLKLHFEQMKSGNKDENAAALAEKKQTRKIEDVLGLTKPS